MTSRLLRDEVRQAIGRIIGLQLLATLTVFVLATLGAGYYALTTELDYKKQVISAKVSAEITTVASSLEALASSPLLWTALSDNIDPQIYLTPLIENLSRNDALRFNVLDYQGRPFVVPDNPFLDPADYQAVAKDNLNKQQLSIHVLEQPDTQSHIAVLVPVVSPASQSVVGFALGLHSIERSLNQMNLPKDTQVTVSFAGQPREPIKRSFFELVSTSTERINTPSGEFMFQLTVTESYASALIIFTAMTMVILVIGLYARRWGMRWASAFSRRTLSRFEWLLTISRRIIRGEKVPIPERSGADEISEIQDTLSKLLTDQARTLDQLKTAASVFQTAGEAIMLTNPQGVILDVNPALLEITGYGRNDLVGQQGGLLYRAAQASGGNDIITEAIAKNGSWRGETVFYNRYNEAIPVQLAVSRVFDNQGADQGQTAIFTDIREIKAAEDRLRTLAYEDALTGLPNYAAFTELVHRRLTTQADASFLLIFLDLDRLKQINDLYGHEKGDEAIQGLATHLDALLPKRHTLCRRSGDEFLALVDFEGEHERQAIEALLNERLASYQIFVDANTVQTTVSAGITEYPRYGKTLKTLLQQSDAALYEAKQDLSDRKVIWYSEKIGDKLQRRLAINASLDQAIRAERIIAHYQPEVEIPSGRILGFEALARWHDPVLGTVTPDEFISVAEENNHIRGLTELMLKQVARDLPLLKSAFPNIFIAVNISPRLFASKRLTQILANLTNHDENVLSSLVLEVTESDLSIQFNQIVSQLQTLRGLGLHIAIDDFGKGYSSLSRLANMPLDKIKIDASFVSGLGQTHDLLKEKMIDIILAFARTMNIAVTAEGVETEVQMLALVKAGCHRAQGWHYSRALALDEALCLTNPIESASTHSEDD